MTAEGSWSNSSVLQNLWDWFCKLPLEDRVQAIAIEDVLWIKLYLLLYKAELKQRRKDRTGASYRIKRDKVRYMYHRLYRRESRGVLIAVGGGATCHDPDEEHDISWLEEIFGVMGLPEGKLCARLADGVDGRVGEDDDEDDGDDEGLEWAHEQPQQHQQQQHVHQRVDLSAVLKAFETGELDTETARREAGELLQRHLRLCALQPPFESLDTLTLSHAILEDPRALFRVLRAASRDAFLSKPISAHAAKQLNAALGPNTPIITAGGSPLHHHLPPEAPWLHERHPHDALMLSEVLVNRFEVSLWAAYWRKVHRSPSLPRALSVGALTEKAQRLTVFSEKLEPEKRIALFDGLRVAQNMLAIQDQERAAAGGKEGGEGAGKGHRWACSSSSLSSSSSSASSSSSTASTDATKTTGEQQQLHQATDVGAVVICSLLFVPVQWAYKDEGQAVRRVLERMQTACADCVADELLADEGSQVVGVGVVSSEKAAKGKKSKKKKKGGGGGGGGAAKVQGTSEGGKESPRSDTAAVEEVGKEQVVVKDAAAAVSPAKMKGGEVLMEGDDGEDCWEEVGSRSSRRGGRRSTQVLRLQLPQKQQQDAPHSTTDKSPQTAHQQHKKQKGVGHEAPHACEAQPAGDGDIAAASPVVDKAVITVQHQRCTRSTKDQPSSQKDVAPSKKDAECARRHTDGCQFEDGKIAATGQVEQPACGTEGAAAEEGDVDETVGWEGEGEHRGKKKKKKQTPASRAEYKKRRKAREVVGSVLDVVLDRVGGVINEREGVERQRTPSPPIPQPPPQHQHQQEQQQPQQQSPTQPQTPPKHSPPPPPPPQPQPQRPCTPDEPVKRPKASMSPCLSPETPKLLEVHINGKLKLVEDDDWKLEGTTSSSDCSPPQSVLSPPASCVASTSSCCSPSSAPSSTMSSPHRLVIESPRLEAAERIEEQPLPPPQRPPSTTSVNTLSSMREATQAPEAVSAALQGAMAVHVHAARDGYGHQHQQHDRHHHHPHQLQNGVSHQKSRLSVQCELFDTRIQSQQPQQHQRRGKDAWRDGYDRRSSKGPGIADRVSTEQRIRMAEFVRDMEAMRSILSYNIEGFMSKLEQEMEPHRAARQLIVDEVSSIIHGLWPQAELKLYGSCFTGLDLVSSDVDIVVCGLPFSTASPHYSQPATPSPTGKAPSASAGWAPSSTSSAPPATDARSAGPSPRRSPSSVSSSPTGCEVLGKGEPLYPTGHSEHVQGLHKLAAALEGKPWIRSMKTIDTAFIPVIKVHANPAGLNDGMNTIIPIDISFESPNHGGLASSLLIRDLIQPGGPYAHAVPLTLVLKTLFSQRGLNHPWGGGLSSYALILMVIAMLQHFETPDLAQMNAMAIKRAVESVKRRLSGAVMESPTVNYCQALMRSMADTQPAVGVNGSVAVPTTNGHHVAVSETGGRGGLTPPAPPQSASPRLVSNGSPSVSSTPPLALSPSVTSTGSKAWGVPVANGQPTVAAGPLQHQPAILIPASGIGLAPNAPLTCATVLHPVMPVVRIPPLSTGFLLTYFLDYYSRVFNPAMEGLAVDRGFGLPFSLAEHMMLHPQSPARTLHVGDPLTILDPLDPTVNVSRCCFRVGEIQWIMGQCLSLLETRGTELAREAMVAAAAKMQMQQQQQQQQQQQHQQQQQQATMGSEVEGQQQHQQHDGNRGEGRAAPAVVDILGLILSY